VTTAKHRSRGTTLAVSVGLAVLAFAIVKFITGDLSHTDVGLIIAACVLLFILGFLAAALNEKFREIVRRLIVRRHNQIK
jgi:Flp pilus assembly protein TadB